MDLLNGILTNIALYLLDAIRRLASFVLPLLPIRNIPSNTIMANPTINIDTSFSSNEGDAVNDAFGVGATPTNAARPNSQSVATPRSHMKNASLHMGSSAVLTPAQKEKIQKGMHGQYKQEMAVAEVRAQTASKVLAKYGATLAKSKAVLANLVEEEQTVKEESGLVDAEKGLVDAEKGLAKAEEDVTKALQNLDLAKTNVSIAKSAIFDAKLVFEGTMSATLIPKLVVARDNLLVNQENYDVAAKDAQDADEELAKATARYEDFLAGCPDE